MQSAVSSIYDVTIEIDIYRLKSIQNDAIILSSELG